MHSNISVSPSLPAIKGKFRVVGNGGLNINMSVADITGCLYATQISGKQDGYVTTGNTNATWGAVFDAYGSSHVYSNTTNVVVPKSKRCTYLIRY